MANITWTQKLFGVLAYLLSIFILLLVLVWMSRYRGGVAWSSDVSVGTPELIFNLHPIMMILGFLVFPTQAVLVYRMLPMEHFKAKVYHFVCHIFAMICVAIGFTSAIVYHYRTNASHFTSLHSWFGLGTMGCFALQFVIGFFCYCFPKLNFDARKATLPVHQYFGIVTFFMACCTSSLGVLQKLMLIQYSQTEHITVNSPEWQVANWLGVSIVILFALVLYVVMGGVKQKRERGSIEEVESLRSRSSYDHDY